MSKITQIAIAAAMTLATHGLTMAPSHAAGMINVLPIAFEANVVKADYFGRGAQGTGRAPGGRKPKAKNARCVWKKKRVWSNYQAKYIIKLVKACN